MLSKNIKRVGYKKTEDYMEDNGISRYMENDDDEGWDYNYSI